MKKTKNKDDGSDPMHFDAFAAACDPKQWRLKIASRTTESGAPHRTTIPWPADKDLAAAIAASGAPPGVYVVNPMPRSRGESGMVERQRLGLGTYQRIAAGVVSVGVADVREAGHQHRRAPGAPLEDPEIAAARKAAEMARHRAAEQEALAKARRAERSDGADGAAIARQLLEQQQQPRNNGDLATILGIIQAQAAATQQLLLSQLDQARQERAQLIEALQAQQQQPARALPELGEVARTMELFRGLREMMAEDNGGGDREPRPWWADMLPALVQRLAPAAEAAAAPASPLPAIAGAPPAATPAPAAAAVPDDLRRARVGSWLATAISEAMAGADPVAVCDGTEAEHGLLPADLRAALDAGDVDAALASLRRHLSGEQLAELEPFLARTEVAAWVGEFVRAHQLEEWKED